MKYKIVTAALAAFLMLPFFGTVAYAGGGDPEATEPEPVVESAVTEPNPFTPDGTGTVVDNATDEDGKEFFTIITPSENVYYLIIDRQRETENVYFLNAVTEADLMALAEPSENVSAIPDPAGDAGPEPVAEPEPEPQPEPEPEATGGGNMGMLLLVVLVVLGGGGAAYYFKILRPKQQASQPEEDYLENEYEGEDDYDDPYGDDDSPPWDVDEDESEGEDA